MQCIRIAPTSKSFFIDSPEGCRVEIHFEDHSFVADHIKISGVIRSKGNDALGTQRDLPDFFQYAIFLCQTPNAARLVISKDINAVERRPRIGSIHEAAS